MLSAAPSPNRRVSLPLSPAKRPAPASSQSSLATPAKLPRTDAIAGVHASPLPATPATALAQRIGVANASPLSPSTQQQVCGARPTPRQASSSLTTPVRRPAVAVVASALPPQIPPPSGFMAQLDSDDDEEQQDKQQQPALAAFPRLSPLLGPALAASPPLPAAAAPSLLSSPPAAAAFSLATPSPRPASARPSPLSFASASPLAAAAGPAHSGADRFIPSRDSVRVACAWASRDALGSLPHYGGDDAQDDSAHDENNDAGSDNKQQQVSYRQVRQRVAAREHAATLADTLLSSPSDRCAATPAHSPSGGASLFSYRASPNSASSRTPILTSGAKAVPRSSPIAIAKSNVRKVLFPAEPAAVASSTPAALPPHSPPASLLSLDYELNLRANLRAARSGAIENEGELSVGAANLFSPSSRFASSNGVSLSPMTDSGLGMSPSLIRSPLERALLARGRDVCTEPYRVLEAPGLENDYYLNLMHWSSRGALAIALRPGVFVWNEATQSCAVLGSVPSQTDDGSPLSVCSVRWSPDGSSLALGFDDASVRLYDVGDGSGGGRESGRMHAHASRVASLDFNPLHPSLLASGSMDTHILGHDLRVLGSSAARSPVVQWSGHSEEVCGLAWSLDGSRLASGANDNRLCIWSLRGGLAARGLVQPALAAHGHLSLTHHRAAVKALAWSPHHDSLLASGGGLADGHIRFCDANTGRQVASIDTASQVCSLQWSRARPELLSAHGHPSFALHLWSYPSRTRLASLRQHSARVLHTALSPDGSRVASAGADQALYFWNMWESSSSSSSAAGAQSKAKASLLHADPKGREQRAAKQAMQIAGAMARSIR